LRFGSATTTGGGATDAEGAALAVAAPAAMLGGGVSAAHAQNEGRRHGTRYLAQNGRPVTRRDPAGPPELAFTA
jgi:hypothetical protein